MSRHITVLAGLLIVLFAVFATAQTSGKSRQSSSSQMTTTQTTTTTTTTSGPQKSIEGCLIKEQSDYFLVPRAGNPIKLQASASENLAEHEGHKVIVSGSETPISSASSSTSMTPSGGLSGTATATTGTNSQTSHSETGAVGASAGTPPAAATGTSTETGSATGTGNDLHKLATQEMTVSKLQHVAATCPVNWNSRVRSSRANP